LNTHYRRTFVVLALLSAGACAFLFDVFYKEAKNTAITKLNEEQMIHAKQAAQGIEDFFTRWTRILNSLSKMDEVIDADAVGKRYLKFFQEAHQEQIMAITRLDERGIVVYNFPASSSVGTDISDQKHVRELLQDHKPVISDVFKAVEGFDAVALHVPIFRGSVFKGSIGILIHFEGIAKRYLAVIKIGDTGYAWVVSRDGTLLYTPIPGFTGKSVFETIKESPSLNVIVNDMLQGHEGAAQYTYDRIGDRIVGPTRKFAVYMPVHLGNTFWSIAVATAEQDVFAALISFKNKLALVIGALFICGMVFSTLGAKAWLIVKEEEKRKQTEIELRESLERFRHVAETVGGFIWQVDAGGLYTYVSQSVEKTLGYTPEELVGKKHFYDLFEPSVREELKAAASQVNAARQSFWDFPNQNVSKSGKIVYLQTSGRPVLDPTGNLVGYRGAATDVTGREQAEHKIAQQRNELAHVARVSAVGQLSSSLAHELNQPLGAILRNAEAAELFLQEPSPDLDEVRAILADIRKDDQRAGEVIDRMRALIKRREVKRGLLDVNLLAGEVVALVRTDAEARRVRLTLETDPAVPPVLGDRVQLQQVLLNLLLNALDAVKDNPPARRRVAVRARPAGTTVEVTVRDEGHGIAADCLPRMFEPFFTSKPNGLGMGLTISRSIIEAHGGRLWAENRPAGGAAFTFTLPAEVSGEGQVSSER
jgi:PAS domain S-box-containing protein